MKIKVAARHISYRTLFHTILILAFLLPFVFILTAVVTLEGVNKCSSFGEFGWLFIFNSFSRFSDVFKYLVLWLFWLWLLLDEVDGSLFDLGWDCFLISWFSHFLHVCIWLWLLWCVWILIWSGVRLFFTCNAFVSSGAYIYMNVPHVWYEHLMIDNFNLFTSFFYNPNTAYFQFV